MTDAIDRLNPAHIGVLIKFLREAAGMTRPQLAKQTKVARTAIHGVEEGRHRASAAILRRLLRSPAMASLPAMAASSGLPMNVGAEVEDLDPGSGSGPERVNGTKQNPSNGKGSGGIGGVSI